MWAVASSGLSSRAPPECLLRAGLVARPILEVLADEAMTAAQSRPGRREAGVLGEALEVDLAGILQLGDLRELVAAEVELVGMRRARPVLARGRASGEGKGLEDPPRQVVLQLEHVAHRRLRRVGPDQRARRGLDELGAHADGLARAQDRAGEHAVDVGLGGDALEVEALGHELLRPDAGADEERLLTHEGGRQRLDQAGREEVSLRIRAQDAKGEHDQADQRLRSGATAARDSGDTLQLARHRRRARRTCERVLLQRATDHAVGGDHGGPAAEGGRLFVQGRVQDLDDALADEGGAARQHLEQDCSEGEQVGADVGPVAPDLFRRHVAGRPEERSSLRQAVAARRARQRRPRQAEVEDLDAVGRQEDVRRLEVAVDDLAIVERLEGREHPDRDRNRLVDLHRPAPEPLAQGLAVEQLHGDEDRAGVVADVEDLADRRMAHAGRHAGLTFEALPGGRISGGRDRLDGHRAAEALVAGGIHDAHAALSDLADHVVVADARGRFGGRGGSQAANQGLVVGIPRGSRDARRRCASIRFLAEPPPPAHESVAPREIVASACIW